MHQIPVFCNCGMITCRKFNDRYLTTYLYAHLYTNISNRCAITFLQITKISWSLKLCDSLDFPVLQYLHSTWCSVSGRAFVLPRRHQHRLSALCDERFSSSARLCLWTRREEMNVATLPFRSWNGFACQSCCCACMCAACLSSVIDVMEHSAEVLFINMSKIDVHVFDYARNLWYKTPNFTVVDQRPILIVMNQGQKGVHFRSRINSTTYDLGLGFSHTYNQSIVSTGIPFTGEFSNIHVCAVCMCVCVGGGGLHVCVYRCVYRCMCMCVWGGGGDGRRIFHAANLQESTTPCSIHSVSRNLPLISRA